MEIDQPVSLDEIQKYLLRNRRRGAAVVSTLGKLAPFLHAVLNTEVGLEILKDDILRTDDLMMKVYREEASEIELAEFRYLRDFRLPLIADRLKVYLEKVEAIKK